MRRVWFPFPQDQHAHLNASPTKNRNSVEIKQIDQLGLSGEEAAQRRRLVRPKPVTRDHVSQNAARAEALDASFNEVVEDVCLPVKDRVAGQDLLPIRRRVVMESNIGRIADYDVELRIRFGIERKRWAIRLP